MPQPKTFGNLPLHRITAWMLPSDADRDADAYRHGANADQLVVRRFKRHVRAGGAAVELHVVVVRERVPEAPSIEVGEVVDVRDASQGGIWLTIEAGGAQRGRWRIWFPRWSAYQMKENVGKGQWSGLFHQAVRYDAATETITFAAGCFRPGSMA